MVAAGMYAIVVIDAERDGEPFVLEMKIVEQTDDNPHSNPHGWADSMVHEHAPLDIDPPLRYQIIPLKVPSLTDRKHDLVLESERITSPEFYAERDRD